MTRDLTIKASPAPPRGLLHGTPAAFALVPRAILPASAGAGRVLAGGDLAFAACEVLIADEERGVVHSATLCLDTLADWARIEGEAVVEAVEARLLAIEAPRPAFAGLDMGAGAGPHLMGVLNVTPDSFSDGGRFADPDHAIAHGMAMHRAGAAVIDVGGESTRPGADPVPPETEIERVVPVIQALTAQGVTCSIDTRHAVVMRAAVEAGAAIVNDVTALTGDPASMETCGLLRVPVMLMHMQGTPSTMQSDPSYRLASLDVHDYLRVWSKACIAAGIRRENICVDPGIGFGKTVAHNTEILSRLGLFHDLGCPLMLGVSRKSFIGKLSQGEPADARLAGSLAAGLAGVGQGTQILRVHDVAETRQALAVHRAALGL